MEQQIIELITERLTGLDGIHVEVINQDSPRIGHFIMVGFKRTDTELVCRWYKLGKYFDCWYRRKKGGHCRSRPYNSDTLYRVENLQSANKLCQLIALGQELAINGQYNNE
ncbi:hypothetical protein [Vibrio sp. THAF190c]|uniref:hypothetical protein n=1 Tax=Vibrio sp. THAF190c TaxID=2587865 RepID=UPI001267F869|nr:hypothetical protein [Vibrio sp. THAF190c]QFT13501.1 hypothetical protein FIV04_26460 [Vibrio sp. THAF190c]